MKIWVTYGEDYDDVVVSQLMSDEKLKFYQGEYDYFFCLDDYAQCAIRKYKIKLTDGTDVLFYVVASDEENTDELILMFKDDIRFLDSFYNELFYYDFLAWLEKIKGLVEINKKYLN
jgi:hypothetical protein